MRIKSLIGTVFVFYIILMIGFNEPAFAAIVWTAQTSGTTEFLTGVSAVNTNIAWATGTNGVILHTTNGGTTWTAQTTGTTEIIREVSAVDVNTAWAVGTNGLILYTTDSGTTWTPQTSGTTETFRGLSAVDANTAWAVGGTEILYTTNAGATWTAQTSGLTIEALRGVSAVDANTAWAVATSGTILHTTDSGTTWAPQTSGTTETLREVWAVDSSTAWAVGDADTILYTDNGGTSWTAQISGTSGEVLIGVSAVDANIAWVVGGGSGEILYTTNAGATWTAQTSGVSSLAEVSAVNTDTAFAVGGAGDIIRASEVSNEISGQINVAGVCEMNLTTASLNFVGGDPINNGVGVGTGQISEVLNNSLGNLQTQVGVYGTNWTDGGVLNVMDGSHTVVATSSGNFASKTPLSTNSLSPTPLGNITPQGSMTTFWDTEIVMDGGNPGYSGALVQTITVDFSCV